MSTARLDLASSCASHCAAPCFEIDGPVESTCAGCDSQFACSPGAPGFTTSNDVLRVITASASADDERLSDAIRSATRPVLVRGLVPRLFASPPHHEWSVDHIARRWGAFRVRLHSPVIVGVFGSMPTDTSLLLSDYIAQMSAVSSDDGRGKGRRQPQIFEVSGDNPALMRGLGRHFTTPPFLHGPSRHPTLLSLGPGGAGLPLHRHGDSWLAQLTGAKRWWLLPPDANLSAVDGRTFRSLTARPPSEWGAELREGRGSGEGARVTDLGLRSVVVEGGQLLFVPRGWYHATENLEGPAVAIGGVCRWQLTALDPEDSEVRHDSAEALALSVAFSEHGPRNAYALSTVGRMITNRNPPPVSSLMRIAVDRFLAPAMQLYPDVNEGLHLAQVLAEVGDHHASRTHLCAALAQLAALADEAAFSAQEWAEIVGPALEGWGHVTSSSALHEPLAGDCAFSELLPKAIATAAGQDEAQMGAVDTTASLLEHMFGALSVAERVGLIKRRMDDS